MTRLGARTLLALYCRRRQVPLWLLGTGESVLPALIFQLHLGRHATDPSHPGRSGARCALRSLLLMRFTQHVKAKGTRGSSLLPSEHAHSLRAVGVMGTCPNWERATAACRR
ncbi:hypothetical protein LX36DRAFT_651622 [Colletotrichum falcatum]|nr:hypothetical protein LX36DRAFT_651622 [Colletotrichum falcatum]